MLSSAAESTSAISVACRFREENEIERGWVKQVQSSRKGKDGVLRGDFFVEYFKTENENRSTAEQKEGNGEEPSTALLPSNHSQGAVLLSTDDGYGNLRQFPFYFDDVFSPDTTQADVFQDLGKPACDAVLSGHNGCIMAYGQTGAGKTYTMMGAEGAGKSLSLGSDGWSTNPSDGLIPRSLEFLFSSVARDTSASILISYVEIYNEKVYDLLSNCKLLTVQARSSQKSSSHCGGSAYTTNALQVEVHTLNDAMKLLWMGAKSRTVSRTAMNHDSNRSHTILMITVSRTLDEEVAASHPHPSSAPKGDRPLPLVMGTLTMVDLAGSEKASKSNASGVQLEEANKINLSLLYLGMVVRSLSEGTKATGQSNGSGAEGSAPHDHPVAAAGAASGGTSHVPYLNSKLTKLLNGCIGGNSVTSVVLCCSESLYNLDETMSTLRFGEQAKEIKCRPKVNFVPVPTRRIHGAEHTCTTDAVKGKAEAHRPSTDLDEENTRAEDESEEKMRDSMDSEKAVLQKAIVRFGEQLAEREEQLQQSIETREHMKIEIDRALREKSQARHENEKVLEQLKAAAQREQEAKRSTDQLVFDYELALQRARKKASIAKKATAAEHITSTFHNFELTLQRFNDLISKRTQQESFTDDEETQQSQTAADGALIDVLAQKQNTIVELRERVIQGEHTQRAQQIRLEEMEKELQHATVEKDRYAQLHRNDTEQLELLRGEAQRIAESHKIAIDNCENKVSLLESALDAEKVLTAEAAGQVSSLRDATEHLQLKVESLQYEVKSLQEALSMEQLVGIRAQEGWKEREQLYAESVGVRDAHIRALQEELNRWMNKMTASSSSPQSSVKEASRSVSAGETSSPCDENGAALSDYLSTVKKPPVNLRSPSAIPCVAQSPMEEASGDANISRPLESTAELISGVADEKACPDCAIALAGGEGFSPVPRPPLSQDWSEKEILQSDAAATSHHLLSESSTMIPPPPPSASPSATPSLSQHQEDEDVESSRTKPLQTNNSGSYRYLSLGSGAQSGRSQQQQQQPATTTCSFPFGGTRDGGDKENDTGTIHKRSAASAERDLLRTLVESHKVMANLDDE